MTDECLAKIRKTKLERYGDETISIEKNQSDMFRKIWK